MSRARIPAGSNHCPHIPAVGCSCAAFFRARATDEGLSAHLRGAVHTRADKSYANAEDPLYKLVAVWTVLVRLQAFLAGYEMGARLSQGVLYPLLADHAAHLFPDSVLALPICYRTVYIFYRPSKLLFHDHQDVERELISVVQQVVGQLANSFNRL